ncbi:MAG: hypothetical protein R3192_03325 [Woeseiaceae bacterium]|nr:hypothetical protein [Woeseiaceae bacterium]
MERLRHLIIQALLLLAAAPSGGAEFEITVLDRHGVPVPDVVVFIEQPGAEPATRSAAAEVMQMMDFRFNPGLLVVRTGTRVQFPNRDAVAHHVYSFSKPNNFVLPMFKGTMRPQVDFVHPGVVAIGCNLHDTMVGYILVVDSPVYGKTDRNGKIVLDAENPHGITVRVWNPNLDLGDEDLAQSVNAGRSAQLTFLLKEELQSMRNSEAGESHWTGARIH